MGYVREWHEILSSPVSSPSLIPSQTICHTGSCERGTHTMMYSRCAWLEFLWMLYSAYLIRKAPGARFHVIQIMKNLSRGNFLKIISVQEFCHLIFIVCCLFGVFVWLLFLCLFVVFCLSILPRRGLIGLIFCFCLFQKSKMVIFNLYASGWSFCPIKAQMTTIMEARSNRRLELIAQRGQTVGPCVLIFYVFHLFDCFGHTTIFNIHMITMLDWPHYFYESHYGPYYLHSLQKKVIFVNLVWWFKCDHTSQWYFKQKAIDVYCRM